ncbi:hypothetical protein SDC9_200618 [bioreactor metagenome]|uniref:Uncharacterized protein n=1 Tax=bioreactor metagenome TaxID=1076179 RepID=A0A645INN4_9ZZZZ
MINRKKSKGDMPYVIQMRTFIRPFAKSGRAGVNNHPSLRLWRRKTGAARRAGGRGEIL